MFPPFSILNRYLFREMLPPFFINISFFTFIFLMKQLLEITDMVVNHKVGLASVFLLLAYTMPYFLQFVLPMSVMMAVLMTLLRMSGDNEILALKAGGLSLYRLLPPVLIFSVLGMVMTGYMTIIGVPSGFERFKQLLLDVATSNLNISLKERTFNDAFKEIMLYINKIDPQSGELHNVLIEDRRNTKAQNTVVAKTGVLVGDPDKMVYHLRLYDGRIIRLRMEDRSSHTIHFETYDIRLDLKDLMPDSSIANKRPQEMSPSQLKDYLEKLETGSAEYLKARMHWHRKFSIPVACLAMGLLAVPLGVGSRNSNKAYGIALCLLFFLLYYLLLSAGSAFGEHGLYPPVLAMWVPNAILGGFGIYLLLRAVEEKPPLINWMPAISSFIANRFKK
jgi:lipopolysaccharide export system permease protein